MNSEQLFQFGVALNQIHVYLARSPRPMHFPTKTDFQGKRVDCIRVDYPQNGAKPKPAPVVNEDEDPIPF